MKKFINLNGKILIFDKVIILTKSPGNCNFDVKIMNLAHSLYFLCNVIFLLCDLHRFSEFTSSRLFQNFLEFIMYCSFFSLIATFLIKWTADAILSDHTIYRVAVTIYKRTILNPCLNRNFFYLKIENLQFWIFFCISDLMNYSAKTRRYPNLSLFKN